MKTFAFALLLATAAPALAATPFQPADLYKLSMVTDPQVSPDGTRVLFTRASFDIQSDTRQNEVWVADVAGDKVTPHLLIPASAKAGGFDWSPDGKRIAYVAPWLGKPQLWVMDVSEGVGRVVTSGKIAPQSPVWSPDGKKIAFVARVEAPAAKIAGMPEKPEGATWAPAPKIITDFRYRGDGSGYSTPGADHVFVTGLDGSAPVQLTKGDRDVLRRQRPRLDAGWRAHRLCGAAARGGGLAAL